MQELNLQEQVKIYNLNKNPEKTIELIEEPEDSISEYTLTYKKKKYRIYYNFRNNCYNCFPVETIFKSFIARNLKQIIKEINKCEK
jgi:hypothetical protein